MNTEIKEVQGEVVGQLPALIIAEYIPYAEAISELEDKFGHIPDPSTKDGYDNIVQGLKEIKTPRVNLEKLRKKMKEPALRRAQAIDSEAKVLRERFEALESPLKNAKEEFDTRKIRAQREALLSALNVKITDRSDDISKAIARVEAMQIDEFPDILTEAMTQKKEVLLSLSIKLEDAKREEARAKAAAEEKERLEAERAKIEADRKAMEIEQAKAAAEAIEARRIEDERLAEERAKFAAEREEAAKSAAKQKALDDAKLAKEREAMEAQRAEQAAIAEAERKVMAEQKAKPDAEIKAREDEARLKAERIAKEEAKLRAKNEEDKTTKMRERLGAIDWSKPSSTQIREIWLILKS